MSLVKFIEEPQFEDYKEVFKDNYILERREDGVILVRAHTNGGPIKLSVENHKSVQQLFKTVGADNKNEIMIFTGSGDDIAYNITKKANNSVIMSAYVNNHDCSSFILPTASSTTCSTSFLFISVQ